MENSIRLKWVEIIKLYRIQRTCAEPEKFRQGWGPDIINVFHRGPYVPHSRSNWTPRGVQLLLEGDPYLYFYRKPLATCNFPGTPTPSGSAHAEKQTSVKKMVNQLRVGATDTCPFQGKKRKIILKRFNALPAKKVIGETKICLTNVFKITFLWRKSNHDIFRGRNIYV